MGDDFPSDVRNFIGQKIHSVAQLELLLLLRGASEHLWTAEEIAKPLYIQPQTAASLLADLVANGFAVQSGPGFYYQPANDIVASLIDRLANLYQERRVAVTSEIYSKPVDFVKAFADAFRVRKEE
jgi:hypothetical protein